VLLVLEALALSFDHCEDPKGLQLQLWQDAPVEAVAAEMDLVQAFRAACQHLLGDWAHDCLEETAPMCRFAMLAQQNWLEDLVHSKLYLFDGLPALSLRDQSGRVHVYHHLVSARHRETVGLIFPGLDHELIYLKQGSLYD
jgi:hypothetical protein